MYEFIKSMYDRGKITAQKVWSYYPRYITKAQAKKIAGPAPAGEDI